MISIVGYEDIGDLRDWELSPERRAETIKRQAERLVRSAEILRQAAIGQPVSTESLRHAERETAGALRLLAQVAVHETAMAVVDGDFAGRLALMLECAILNPSRNFDEACDLLDAYQKAVEEVCPSPPTFMGEPIFPD